MARRMARSHWRLPHGCTASIEVAKQGLRRCAHGRYRGGQWPLRDHGRCGRFLRFHGSGWICRSASARRSSWSSAIVFKAEIKPGAHAAAEPLPGKSGTFAHRPHALSHRRSVISIAVSAGFERQAILGLNLRAPGMEFASEMVVKASLASLEIAEVPTTLSPDGRQRAPHLRPWRDGWRHLRFMLLRSPQWLFLYPGLLIAALGLVGSAMLTRGPIRVPGLFVLDINGLLYCSIAGIVGVQITFFGLFAMAFARKMHVRIAHGFPEMLLRTASNDVAIAMGACSRSGRDRRRDLCGSAMGTFIVRSPGAKRNDANHHSDR